MYELLEKSRAEFSLKFLNEKYRWMFNLFRC